MRAAAGGGGDSGSAEPQATITGWRVLIGREVLVYLAEQGQLNVDTFSLLGFWNRRGTDSVCPTTSTVTSPAEIPHHLAFIAWLYHGIEATNCQAERVFSELAHLIGDLRSRMPASKNVDRTPRPPTLVQSFLGILFLVCFVAVLGVVLRYQWHSLFSCLSFFMRLLLFIQDET